MKGRDSEAESDIPPSARPSGIVLAFPYHQRELQGSKLL